MNTKNFNNYFDLFHYNEKIDDEKKKLIKKYILKIDSFAIKFSDDNYEEKSDHSRIISGELRDLLELFLEIKSYDIDLDLYDEYQENETPYNKINFLDNKGYIKREEKNALHFIRQFSNSGQHLEEKILNKSSIISCLNYVSIILHFILNEKKSVSFKSEEYYIRNQKPEKIYEKIKQNINDRNTETIKINDEKIINLLFDPNIDFNIPLYQRGYSWDINHIQDLFNDINKRIEDGGDHFFGNVSFIKEKTNKRKTIKIVDGQQRITTMLLFLKVLYEKYIKIFNDPEKLDEPLKKMIERKQPPLIRIDDDFSVSILKKIWKNNYYELKQTLKESKELQNKIYVAYKYIYENIGNNIEELDNAFTSLKRFIIGINWTTLYNEFELFESLNAKGNPLSDFDILKNYLFSIVDQKIDNENILGKIFNNKIQIHLLDYQKKLNVITEKFLQEYIYFNDGQITSGKKLFGQFKNIFEKTMKKQNRKIKNISLDEYKEIIYDFSKMILTIIFTQIGSQDAWKNNMILQNYFNYYFPLLKATGYSSILIIYFMNSKKIQFNFESGNLEKIINPNEFKRILKLLEIWKIRRDVSFNEGNETIGSHIRSFNSKFKKELNNSNSDDFYEILKSLIEKQDGFLILPSIEEFKNALEKNLYQINQLLILFFIELMKILMEKELNEKVIINITL